MGEIIFKEKGTDFCTPVSNQFLAAYLPQASGSCVKVYLYVYYQFYNQTKGLSLSHVAEALGMMEDDVIEALTYWQSKGQVIFERSGSTCRIDFPICCPTGGPDGGRHCRKEDSSPHKVPETTVVRMEQVPVYAPEELSLYAKNATIKPLFAAVSDFLGAPASVPNLSLAYSFYDYYRMPVDLILYILNYCKESDRRNLRYVEKIVQTFTDKNIRTVEAAEAHLMRSRRFHSIMAALGLGSSLPNDAQQVFMTRWLDEYQSAPELIEEAARRTLAKTGKPAFAYMDQILKNWHDKGFTTMEAVQAGDMPLAAAVGQKNDAFHNMTGTGTDYDAIAKASQQQLFKDLEQ